MRLAVECNHSMIGQNVDKPPRLVTRFKSSGSEMMMIFMTIDERSLKGRRRIVSFERRSGLA